MRQLFRPTLIVAGLNLAALFVTFTFQVIVAATFGAKSEMDAYLAAFVLPSVLNAVLLGSVGFVFVPIFIQHRSKEGPRHAWEVASAVLNLAALVFGLLTIAGILLRHRLLAITVPGLEPAALELAAELAVFLWPTLFFGGLSAILIGLNQAEERFAWQAFVPLVGSVLQLAAVVGLGKRLGIVALALAVLASGIVQLALLLPTVLQAGRYRFRAALTSAGVVRVVHALIPVIVSRLFADASGLIDRYLGSLLVVGSIAQLNYASRIPLLAISLFSAPIGVTIFPLMSRAAAEDDLSGLRRAFSAGIRYTWLFYMPLVVIISVLSKPLIATLLERGEFRPSDTLIVASLLPWYMLSVAARALASITNRTLYALERTRLMAVLNVVSIVMYIAAVVPLVRWLGITGIPLAAVLSDWLFCVVCGVLIWSETGRVIEVGLLKGVARISVAALVGGLAALFVHRLTSAAAPVQLLTSGATGFLTCVAILLLLGAPEVTHVTRMMVNRVPRLGTS